MHGREREPRERGGRTERGGREPEEAARRERRRRARKERVLHTRISEELAEDIRRMADELRVPVSNIVRNVLEETFSVVETVTDNVGDLVEDAIDEAEAAAARIRRQRRRRRRTAAARPADEEPADAGNAARPDAAAGPPELPDASDVLGWQPMVLARAQVCGGCGKRLERGAHAHAAVSARGIGAAWLCDDCLSERRR